MNATCTSGDHNECANFANVPIKLFKVARKSIFFNCKVNAKVPNIPFYHSLNMLLLNVFGMFCSSNI